MSNEKISVIMSVYNEEKYLSQSIESIINQTYPHIEFIIINDGSTDNTESILDYYAQLDKRIIVVNQINMGLTKSLNNGIKLSTGKYIARQDADDTSEPNRIEEQKKFLEKNHHTSLCFSWRRIVDVNDNVLTNFYISHFWPVIKYRIQARRHSYAHGMVMFRTDHIKKIGLYDESKYRAQDYFLWKKAVDNGYRIGVIRKILYNERFRLSITHKTELDYYLRLHNLYFRAQNRKMIFQTFKELHKRRNLNINQFIKFLIAIQPISYKSIFKYL